MRWLLARPCACSPRAPMRHRARAPGRANSAPVRACPRAQRFANARATLQVAAMVLEGPDVMIGCTLGADSLGLARALVNSRALKVPSARTRCRARTY